MEEAGHMIGYVLNEKRVIIDAKGLFITDFPMVSLDDTSSLCYSKFESPHWMRGVLLRTGDIVYMLEEYLMWDVEVIASLP